MPPSGFSHEQSKCVADFLRACTKDLIRENKGIRAPSEAIVRELQHIQIDRKTVKRDPMPSAVLELTKSYYEKLKQFNSKDFDELDQHSEELLISLEHQIEEIKVIET